MKRKRRRNQFTRRTISSLKHAGVRLYRRSETIKNFRSSYVERMERRSSVDGIRINSLYIYIYFLRSFDSSFFIQNISMDKLNGDSRRKKNWDYSLEKKKPRKGERTR